MKQIFCCACAMCICTNGSYGVEINCYFSYGIALICIHVQISRRFSNSEEYLAKARTYAEAVYHA